jgi:single-strand DNA-binding protein
MAHDLNKVQIIGRLGQDPEMRYTPQGAAVTNFSVAAGRAWKDQGGQSHEETEWFRCVAWDKLGELCNQCMTKGARVYIEGRLKTRKWTDRDGADRYTTEVVVSDMIMLGDRRDAPPITDADAPVVEEPAPAAPPRRLAGPRTTAVPPRNQPQPLPEDGEIPF